MMPLPREYLLLFNAITDAEETLRHLRTQLILTQQQAEQLFLESLDGGDG